MKGKANRIMFIVMLLAFFGVIVYAGWALLKDISLASILVFGGILLMFGSPTIYFLGGAIASFCGHKVIGQVVSTKYFSGDVDSSGGWQVNYVYTDIKGKMRFGTINCGHRQPAKTVLVRYLGWFHWAKMQDEISQEEYDTYEWSNIEMNSAETAYKRYNKIFWIVTPLVFVLSIVLIIIGAILIT